MAERTADSLSRNDIQTAVNAASVGDAVILPAGTNSDFVGTVTFDAGIEIRGNGRLTTILVRSSDMSAIAFFTCDGNNGEQCHFSGMTLDGNGATVLNRGLIINGGTSGECSSIKVHDCKFAGTGRAGIYIQHYTSGVIWNCDFEDCAYQGYGYGVVVYARYRSEAAYGTQSWSDGDDFGGSNAIFVEDCTCDNCRHVIACNRGGRYVARYNTFTGNYYTNHFIDMHGATVTHRGSYASEIYQNTINMIEPNAAAAFTGGQSLIYDNTITGISPSNKIIYWTHGTCCAANDCVYPEDDQCTGIYIWDNTYDGMNYATLQATYPDRVYMASQCTDESPPIFVEDRDYFYSEKPAYTPYTYPHPLRSGADIEVGVAAASSGAVAPNVSVSTVADIAVSPASASESAVGPSITVSAGDSVAIYYVSQVDGNDSNDGLFQTDQGGGNGPWLTVNKVNNFSFSPGDTIAFKSAGEWRERLAVPSSGSAGNPITFTAYGTGNAPIINGSSVETTWIVADDITADNFLSNGKFTSDTTGWSTDNSGSIASIGGGQDGNCLELTIDGGSNPAAYQDITTVPGEKMNVTVYVKQGTESTYRLIIYDETNDSQISTTGNQEATGSWVLEESTEFTVPALCVTVRVYLRMIATAGAGTTMLFDEVTAYRTELFKKTFSNAPTVMTEDAAYVDLIEWDTDSKTTFAGAAAGSWSKTGATGYIICTDKADPDTHTMEVSAAGTTLVYCATCVDQSYVTFDGMAFHKATTSGVRIRNTAGNNVTNVTVQNCTFYLCGGAGIETSDAAKDGTYGMSALLIDSNTVNKIAYHGIYFGHNTYNSTISNNTVYDCGWRGDFTADSGHGISSWSDEAVAYPNANTIEYNTVYNQEAYGGLEGTGIQADGRTSACIYRYNKSYDNGGGGYFDNGGHWGTNAGSQWYYNLAWDNATVGMKADNTKDVDMFNNVIYSNDSYGILITSAGATGCEIKNNILSENDTYEIRVDGDVVGTPTMNYNCVYHSGGGTFMRWKGTDYNWADWLTNSTESTHSLNTDPLMTAPATDDFTLQVGSPCINAGTDVGLISDYAGNIVGALPDTGAYEIQGTGKGSGLHQFMDLTLS